MCIPRLAWPLFWPVPLLLCTQGGSLDSLDFSACLTCWLMAIGISSLVESWRIEGREKSEHVSYYHLLISGNKSFGSQTWPESNDNLSSLFIPLWVYMRTFSKFDYGVLSPILLEVWHNLQCMHHIAFLKSEKLWVLTLTYVTEFQIRNCRHVVCKFCVIFDSQKVGLVTGH